MNSHSSVDGHFNCFQVFAITNNDALASLSFVELCTYVRVSLGLYLEVRLLGQRGCLSQHYRRVPNNFLKWFWFLCLNVALDMDSAVGLLAQGFIHIYSST